MKKMWLSLSIVVGLVFMQVPSAWTDWQAGLDAYQGGDYDTALKEFRPLAEELDTKAQFNLGLMYLKGQGVKQDYSKARYWFRESATWGGEPEAQFNLGVMYDKGHGGPREAVKWYYLAVDQGHAKA